MKTLTLGFCLIGSVAFGQLVIGSNASNALEVMFASSNGTNLVITDDLIVRGDKADFSKIILSLSGASQDLTIARGSSAITLGGLIVGAGGTGGIKNLMGGTWEVNGDIVFNNGVVVPQTNSNGKLVHTIATGTTGSITVNDPSSYVNGTFYSKGKGTRFFPIGNGSSGAYFPAQLSSVDQGDLEIGMQVVNSNSGLTGFDIFETRHWVVIDPSNSFTDALVSLSTLSPGNFSLELPTVVVGGASTGQPGVSFQGAPNGDFMVASKKITTSERIFTLAHVSKSEITVNIKNVITPNQDLANDFLFIENIDIFPDNKVTMLDRWGVLVREWANFANATSSSDAGHDLSKMPTGNYIVILEYREGSTLKKLSQMVTIINQ